MKHVKLASDNRTLEFYEPGGRAVASYPFDTPTDARKALTMLIMETEEGRTISIDQPNPEDGIERRLDINRARYVVRRGRMNGREIRDLPLPPVSWEYDLWLQVPGSEDRKIDEDEAVTITDGIRFWTTPRFINAGASNDHRASEETT